MAPVPMMSVVPMTSATASAPSSSHVIQLEPSEVVFRDWLCGHLFRRRSDRQRSRAPNVQTEGGDGANEPGQKISSVHLWVLNRVGPSFGKGRGAAPTSVC